MIITRVVAALASLLLMAMLAASNAQAQACGNSFADISISDPEGNSVPGVTIELVAQAPYDYYSKEYMKLLGDSWIAGNPWNNPALSSPELSPAVKIPARDAEEIIKQSVPMDRAEDFCGNPLKRQDGATSVKTYQGAEKSEKKLGFCTLERYPHLFLLEISAPRYLPAYYVGPFLSNCRRTYKIVLTKKEESV